MHDERSTVNGCGGSEPICLVARYSEEWCSIEWYSEVYQQQPDKTPFLTLPLPFGTAGNNSYTPRITHHVHGTLQDDVKNRQTTESQAQNVTIPEVSKVQRGTAERDRSRELSGVSRIRARSQTARVLCALHALCNIIAVCCVLYA